MIDAQTKEQRKKLATAPVRHGHTAFAEGPAGAGQRALLTERLLHLARRGAAGRQILVLVPDRLLIPRYRAALEAAADGPAPAVQFFTYYTIAKRAVELFWPTAGPAAGFADPYAPPVLLTYETAQHVMSRVAGPKIEQGFFEELALPAQRLVGQLISSMNAAAASGFPLEEIAPRLSAAWTGEALRTRYYEQAQQCIAAYRQRCLEQGLVDVALLMELFAQVLVPDAAFWRYLTTQYRHLLVPHVEENVPVAHDFIRRFLKDSDSALLLCEQDGGVRPFLHVDPAGGYALHEACHEAADLGPSQTTTPALEALAARISAHLEEKELPAANGSHKAVRGLIQKPFRPDMLRAVAGDVKALCEQGTPPGEIALLAPAVDGVLRFTLEEELRAVGLPLRVLRRHERLGDEPLVRAMLTLAALAHPAWQQPPARHDAADMLARLVGGLDPVRAALLAEACYDADAGRLHPHAGRLDEEKAARLGPALLRRYDALQGWVAEYADQPGQPLTLDRFVRRFFNEQLGGPETPKATAALFSELVRSIEHFRAYASASALADGLMGATYAGMVREGTVAAQYPARRRLTDEEEDAVTLAPVYTYLLTGRPVRYQFWLDLGAPGWWRSLEQALTNPVVLSHRWPEGEKWTEPRDFATRTDLLRRIVLGLTRRCTGTLTLCTSDRRTSGEAQDSPLLRAAQAALASG